MQSLDDQRLSTRIRVCLDIMHERNMEKSKIVVQLMAGFAAALSMGCAGFHRGWSSPSLPKLLADDSDIPITSGEGSWIVSFDEFGCAIGPLIAFVLVDRCGRKLTLLLTVVPYLVGCILLGAAQSYWWFLVARFSDGLGAGMSYIVPPMYLGEIADDRIRGALASLISLMSNLGILLAYSDGPWVDRVVLAVVGGALPLLFGMMFIWMPESPYFLVMNGKLDRAAKSLKRLKELKDVNDELDELKKVQNNVEFDCRNAGTVRELVMLPGNRKAMIIILGLTLAQQCSGIFAIQVYTSLIFEESGSTLDSSISAIVIGVIQIITGVLITFVVDLAGRRPLVIFFACGSILFLAGEAIYFQLQAAGTDVSGLSWFPLTVMVAYIIRYRIGLGSLPFVVLSEIFPCNVKALATTVASIAGSLCGMAIGKLYQIVADGYGIHVCFWGFAVLSIFSVIFMYFVLPETKQRSLRNIQEELHKTTELTVGSEKSEAANGF